MNKISFFFFALALSFLLSGCFENSQSPFVFPPNLSAQKINNLADFNEDKKSDLIFWNTSSMSGAGKFLEQCFIELADVSSNKVLKSKFGEVADIPFVGYFDEDSVIDYGIYRSYKEGASDWIIKDSVNNNSLNVKIGKAGDIPLPVDIDGDERADIVIYRPQDTAFEGVSSRTGLPFSVKFGITGDIPVLKDYDGDGKADLATYRQKTGIWTIRKSKNNETSEIMLGGPSFFPIPADYDGDGKCDLCVWDNSNNSVKCILTILRGPLSGNVVDEISKRLGNKTLFPVSSDYDGDGASEISFWDESSKKLITFNVKNELKEKTYNLNNVTNSLPINNYVFRILAANKFLTSSLDEKTNLHLFKDGNLLEYKNVAKDVLKNKKPSELFKSGKTTSILPFLSDFDGDYVKDLCLWSKNTGIFLCNSSRVGWKFALQVGQKTDKPIIGNFNRDNITDIGAYRAANQTFYLRYLGKSAPQDIELVKLSVAAGVKGIPQIADYDNDGISDLAVYNTEKNVFVIRKSSDLKENLVSLNEKDSIISGVYPICGDFDGDGESDPAFIDLKKGNFRYFSSSLVQLINQAIPNVLSSLVFSSDLDRDLNSDLVFLNLEQGSLEIAESSNNFRTRKIKFTDSDIKGATLVNCPWLY